MSYQPILQHYQDCLQQHGDTPQGVDWPNALDMQKRYAVMAGVMRADEGRLLDYGCGTGDFFQYLQQHTPSAQYLGIDANQQAIAHAKKKYPTGHFLTGDVLVESELQKIEVDYVVLNGVLTVKRSLSFDAMWHYAQQLLQQLFSQAKQGMAFNVMSACVDWQRDDLFHLPMDLLEAFVVKQLAKNYVLRRDYGLYEYTVYVYR